jgi:N-acetylmuramoyl-L-alanine amidase
MSIKTKIIIHMSETPPSMNIGFAEIDSWHKERGFKSPHPDTGKMIHCGYHVIVRRDEKIELGRDFRQNGAHTLGENAKSLAICWIGGKGGDNRTEWQKNVGIPTAIELCREFIVAQEGYPLPALVELGGHKDYQARKEIKRGVFVDNLCPNFDVRKEYGTHI